MVSTRKKRQSNRRLFSQLDDFDQDVIIGNVAGEERKDAVVNEGGNGRDFNVGTSSDTLVTDESTVNVETFERCFTEKIDREMSNIVDTNEDRIQNAILNAINSIVAPKIKVEIRSINASSGRDATSVTVNSERRKHVGNTAYFENASGNNNVLLVSNVNDETQRNLPDEVSELSVPDTRFDWQTHTHHMATGQSNQTDQISEFLTRRILTPRNPPSPQHQNLSTQVSQNNSLPMVEQLPRNQNSDTNNSINHLADAIAGIATQQRPQAATMLKPVSTNTLIFDGKSDNIDFFEDLFTQCSTCNHR